MTSLASIPLVLGDRIPFVLQTKPSPLPWQELADCRLRRGEDRIAVEMPMREAYLNTVILEEAGASYVVASAGPLLADLWADPGAFLRGTDLAVCPRVVAAIQGRSMPYDVAGVSTPVAVRVVPPPPPPSEPHSMAVVGTSSSLAENIEFGLILSIFAARGIMDVLNECATVRGSRPRQSRWHSESIDKWITLVGDGVEMVSNVLDFAKNVRALL